jgi:hypothetical protein
VTCAVCKQGETQTDDAAVTLERGQTVALCRNVPVRVCATYAEAYVSEEVTA